MRAITMDFDARLRLDLAVGVAADVVATVDDLNLEAEFDRAPLRNREAEKTRTDNDDVRFHRCPSYANVGPTLVGSRYVARVHWRPWTRATYLPPTRVGPTLA